MYSYISLAKESKTFVRVYWEGDLYQFLCLCLGLAPAPYVFNKLLKTPVVSLLGIDTLIIIYLGNKLLIGSKAKNIEIYCDTVVLLLQELGFLINLKKLVMTLSHEMEFLGMVINFKEMTISLPEEKLQKVKLHCLDFYQSPKVLIL